MLAGHDIVFLALPHGQSGQYTDALASTPLVIDAGADHRLESADDWDRFYGGHFHEPWAYGVPELLVGGAKQRERLVGASRIAAPGCNASTVSLSLAPGVAAGVIDPSDIVTVLAVGPSGAGKSLKTNLLASEILGSANPYAVGGTHRHIPEIRQALAAARRSLSSKRRRPDKPGPTASGSPSPPSSCRWRGGSSRPRPRRSRRARPTPTSATRGRPPTPTSPSCICCPAGSFPRTADVVGANTALIGLAIDRDANRVVVVTALDNLVKGTAGAAVQSMNIALGLPEGRALTVNGVAP